MNSVVLSQFSSIPPEILEAGRCKLRVPNGVLNVLMPQVVLNRAGVVPVVGEFIARCMPQHVWMHWEWDACPLPGTLHHLAHVIGCHRAAPLARENVAAVLCLFSL